VKKKTSRPKKAAVKKQKDPNRPGGWYGWMFMRPEPGRLAIRLAALKREREALEQRRLTDQAPKGTIKRTSIRIGRRIARLRSITAHISPYINGLAPETRTFVAELNAESERLVLGVRFTAMANRIEVTGDVEAAAERSDTICGWFIGRAINVGYLDGDYGVLRRCNSEWRKALRRRAKTKAGKAEAAAIAKAQSDRLSFLCTVRAAAGELHVLIKAIPKPDLAALGLTPHDFDPNEMRIHPARPQTNFREPD
jgi:hypothetical protein